MDDRRYYGLDALRGGMMMLGIHRHFLGAEVLRRHVPERTGICFGVALAGKRERGNGASGA